MAQLDRNRVDYAGRLILSDRAHLVMQAHLEADAQNESDIRSFILVLIVEKFLGTTKRGIGPTYSAKALRAGLRVGDLFNWDQFLLKYDSLTTRFREQ